MSVVRHWAVGVTLLALGCKGAPPVRDDAPVTVQRLQVSFDAAGRGELQLGLFVRGSKGTATQAQWQLLLDGRPVGSGVQLLSQRMNERGTAIDLTAPLPLPRANRDEGWRNVALEISGELSIDETLAERFPFAFRRQALVSGAPRP